MPAAFSIIRRNGAVYGNLWTAGATPTGATSQWVKFDLTSESFAGKGEHAPVALFLDAQALTAAAPAIVGNGMVYGDVHLASNGCGGPAAPGAPAFNTEIEAYWASGNHLWSSSCGSVALTDGPAYRIVLEAGVDGSVSYVNSNSGSVINRVPAVATLAERPPLAVGNGGVMVASTNFCPGCGDFSLDFSNVAAGWSIGAPDGDALSDQALPLSPSADSVVFPAQQEETPGEARQVTFVNTGSAPLDVMFDVAVGSGPHCGATGSASACAQEIDEAQRSYIVTGNGCSPVLPGSACMASIAFDPQGSFRLDAVLAYRTANEYVPAVTLEGVGVPAPVLADTVPAVEYFNPVLGHYFVTTLPAETAVLDTGVISGWLRTGQWFWAYPGTGNPAPGHNPVCRFYGLPAAGLDSHFYSASPAECAAVLERFPNDWILESWDLFDVVLPNTGTGSCPAGFTSVYRLYNGRPDANHRYTTDAQIRASMVAAGWIAEGYGPIGVVMCAPGMG